MALLDVMRTARDLVEDPTEGLNAAIAQVNAAKGTAAPAFQTIEPLKAPMPEKLKGHPAFFQVPAGGTVGEQSQSKRRHIHILEWHALWRWTEQDYQIVAATIEAMAIVLQRLEGRGSVARVRAPGGDGLCRIASTGFIRRQTAHTIVQLVFEVHERDENPLS